MSKKHKKVCTSLNYIEHVFLASTITGCILISAFASLIGIPKAITISVIGFIMCVTAAGVKKYKSIIEKNRDVIKSLTISK